MKLPPLTAGCSLALPTPTLAPIVALLIMVASACSAGGSQPPTTATTTSLPATTPVPPVSESESESYRVVVAGDISCLPGRPVTTAECQMGATADLVASLDPDVVMPLGDLQYELGKAADYEASYATNWGRFRDVTRPVVGNHEYTLSLIHI